MIHTLSFYLSLASCPEEEPLIKRLYDKYEILMYSVAYSVLKDSYLAEESVHEAFIRIIKSRAVCELDFGRRTEVFVSTVVRNAAIDIFRKKRRITEHEKQLTSDDPGVIGIPDTSSVSTFELNEIISALPIECKEIIELYYFEGYSFSEISALLGVSVNIVYYRHKKALALLREQLA